MKPGVTLLWALRSPCNLGCKYCYFGTDIAPALPFTHPGALTHQGKHDLTLPTLLTFIATIPVGSVQRVFIAGGEPLLWPGTQRVLTALKHQGCEVIVCTNGLPLRKTSVVHGLLGIGIDAISVSLDSFDATYNDTWRPDKSGAGWQGVVEGLQTMVRVRNELGASTKIGVYSVITQQNISHITQTGRFVAGLGVDYFIIQPISLPSDHVYYEQLHLDACHRTAFIDQLKQLQQARLGIHLAHPNYLQHVLLTLSSEPLPVIKGCFGGRDLFFIEPDGSVWDCPSQDKIQHTTSDYFCSITHASAVDLFSPERRCRNTDCSLFSQDCVNMWQLMHFDTILAQGGHHHHEQLL